MRHAPLIKARFKAISPISAIVEKFPTKSKTTPHSWFSWQTPASSSAASGLALEPSPPKVSMGAVIPYPEPFRKYAEELIAYLSDLAEREGNISTR